MGLDMYLSRKARADETEDVGLMYWRKANHIHRYFTEGVEEDNCTQIKVTEEDLVGLIDKCMDVLDRRESAKELLPTQSGFFFGNVEYNEYYFSDIRDTLEGLSNVLKVIEPNDELYYYAWY